MTYQQLILDATHFYDVTDWEFSYWVDFLSNHDCLISLSYEV